MFNAIRQAIRALLANPTRTLLTTLGIIIGIATVILVLSAGAGFRSLIDSQVAAFGTNTLFVQTRVPPTTKSRAANSNQDRGAETGIVITTLKQYDIDTIKQLPNVENAYGMITGLSVGSYRNNQKSVLYYGASAERFEIDQGTLKDGRFFTAAENDGADQVVVLGSELAKNLFNQDDPIGKLVRIGTLNFQVVGVYNPRGDLGGFADQVAYMPLVTAQKKMLGVDHLSMVVVQMQNPNLGEQTAEQVRLLLRHNHNVTSPEKDDFLAQTQAEALGTFNTIFSGITILLICIAAISLMVGGVGIMNIMYVVVTERTSEIGLKKALGATYKNILSEFLIESILVTVCGGVFGIILGALLAFLVSVIASAGGLSWAFVVPLYAIAIGFGVSATIGILFGVLPARSAAKLDPIEALRYE